MLLINHAVNRMILYMITELRHLLPEVPEIKFLYDRRMVMS